jgi:hypothetical protein
MAIRQTMSPWSRSRRDFLKAAGAATGVAMPAPGGVLAQPSADYTLTIATKPLEVAPNCILSVTTYNGHFPVPLLRFKEGQQLTIDIRNQTDTPEQLHWHGQFVSTEVEPTLSRGGDMAMDFLSPAATVASLKDQGESKRTLPSPRGCRTAMRSATISFTINGHMLGHGEPIRVKQRERVLFHILNGSATEIRSLALPGHSSGWSRWMAIHSPNLCAYRVCGSEPRAHFRDR